MSLSVARVSVMSLVVAKRLRCRTSQLGFKVSLPNCSHVLLAMLNDNDPHEFSKEEQMLAMRGIEAFLTTLQPLLARWEQIFRELGLEE